MKIFLSWSGELSNAVAKLLKEYLPYFIQTLQPYLSSHDIDKGSNWFGNIAENLQECCIGIVCLTQENKEAPWIMFEAGALSKSIGQARVCTLMINVTPTDIKGPLTHFQATQINKDDFFKLITTINNNLKDSSLSDILLRTTFEQWWDKFETNLNKILNDENLINPEVDHRSDRELFEEILELSRFIARNQPMRITFGYGDNTPNQYLIEKDGKISFVNVINNPFESNTKDTQNNL